MAAPASHTTINADLVRGHLARIDLAAADIRQEVAGLPQRAASAGQELVACVSKTATLRDGLGDLTRLTNGTVQDIANLARISEEVLDKVKDLVSISKTLKRYRWDSPEAKIEKYRKRVDEAILRLFPPIDSSTVNKSQSSAPPPQASSSLSISPPATDSSPIPPAAPSWTKAIGPARSTLKVVSAVTPIIPVVGQFIQCGVDVGNGLLDMFDGMSQNDEKASALFERVSRLSDLVAVFQDRKQAYHASKPMLKYLEGFRTQCDSIRNDVDVLKAQARFGKFVFSQSNTGSLSNLNGKIDEALKDLTMYLQLNTEYFQRIQERDRLLDRLGDAAFGDVGNASEDGLCFEETRVEILERIDGWTDNTSFTEQILWLRGQAGRGKSTIARTAMSRFATRFKENGSSAIFHFRRGNETLNKRVVPALARQIARGGDERITEVVLQAIRDHLDVAQSRPEDQFKSLIVEPLQKLGKDSPPVLLVIDALDECADRELVRVLLRLVQDHSPSLPSVKFLITSRPEHHIINAFDNLLRISEDLDTGDLQGSAIQDDLRAFYMDRLARIKGLEDQWKSMDVVKKLVDRSERLFQWANTVMKYIEATLDPQLRLERIINNEVRTRGLDGLYTQILSEAFPSESEDDPDLPGLLQHVLGSLAVSPHPITLSVLRYLWSDSTDPKTCSRHARMIHREVLARMTSMFIVPDLDSPDADIRFVHTSVRDFLTKKTKDMDERFLINPTTHHTRLAEICFQRMKRDLLPDICGFQKPSQTNNDVRDQVAKHVSTGLKYCCRSWSAHLSGVAHNNSPEGCTAVNDLLDGFCQKQLLNWLEVLSLTGVWSEAITMADQSRDWLVLRKDACVHDEEGNTSNLLYDVRMFSVQFRQAISFSARHISRSAMVYCPSDMELWHRYRSSLVPMPRVVRGPVSRTWPNTIWTGRGHSSLVRSVAFSPDGMILVSGSDDNTIRLWNPASGTPVGEPLKGHSNIVMSVVFSHDGKMLASGSDDNTIRLWNPASGTPIGEPLKGHSDAVRSVAFSHDGKMLASGSDDNTICLWNLASGMPVGEPLKGHSNAVTSVAFSHDGKMLASGSWDNTIRLWNPASGTPISEPLKGHSNTVRSVVFSHDGKMLASGSGDKTICLWNPESGTPLGEPLKGHSGDVMSVAFSHNGKMLASGSDDNTIRLWNPASGMPLGEPLKGHSNTVRSVAFSHNGKMLASGSSDNTIRLWNPASGTAIGEPLKGHSRFVRSMAFSHDGKMLASGSDDNTVRLWNPASGTSIGEPLKGHSNTFTSVAFSHDGTMLASGSYDNTIRLWNPASGMLLGEPLKGHSNTVTSMVFSHDGKMLASGSDDKTIRLWNPASGTPIGEPLKGHSRFVTNVAFSHDDKMLASGSGDNTIRLWNPASGTPIGEPLKGHYDWVTSMVFSRDGATLFSESHDGQRMTWKLPQIDHIIPNSQSVKSPGATSKIRLYGQNDHDGRMGWVFRDDVPWFWMPEEFFMDSGQAQDISFSGNTSAIAHRNIHILDVSAIM